QVAVSGLNLSGTQEYDYFYVTVPSGTTGTMTVSMQSTNLSSVSPRLTVLCDNKVAIGTSSLPNSYGATATVTVTGVTPGQGFYIRCSAASGMGSYGAYGLEVNFGSGTQPPIAPPITVVAQRPDHGGGSENEVVGPTVMPWDPGAPQLVNLNTDPVDP